MSRRRAGRNDAQRQAGGHRGLLIVAATLCLATFSLVWFGWAATRDLRRAAAQRVRRRTEATLVLLGIALDRDMQGAWSSVLVPIEPFDLQEDPPYDFLQLSARAFARFSYVESFIVWKPGVRRRGVTYVFNRADRVVPWEPAEQSTIPYPVVLQRNPPPMQPLVDLIKTEAIGHRRFALLTTSLAGVPYQVIVHLMFDSTNPPQLTGFVGFLVNLDWVRRNYFAELLPQITTLAGGQGDVALSVTDAAGRLVATSGGGAAAQPVLSRTFPLLFFDERLMSPDHAAHDPIEQWTASVRPTEETVAAAQTAGGQTFVLIAFAAVAALVSLLLVMRAMRIQAELAAMKSEFVSTVTHELKTPLALIKLVGETLEKGRYTSGEVVREYAGLLSQETTRLGQLIENLLTFSRLSDGGQVYTFEPIDPVDLVEDALREFWPRLNQLGFDVRVEIAPGLPPVRADRTAMLHVLGNVIDNAIKYSAARRMLAIEGATRNGGVAITVGDAGVGIAEEDLDKVFEKFYRGHGTNAGGSGLGLTIACRVVERHGGRIRVESTAGEGTRVEITIPRAES